MSLNPVTAAADQEAPEINAAAWDEGYEVFQSGDLPAAAALWRDMLKATPQGTYTLQVLTACDGATVGNYFRLFKEHGRMFAVPVGLKGRSCYRVGLEMYPSKQEAEAALAAMPGWVRDQRTVVKNVNLLVR